MRSPPPRVSRGLPYISVSPSMQYNHPILMAYTILHSGLDLGGSVMACTVPVVRNAEADTTSNVGPLGRDSSKCVKQPNL
jgi:hypothetical protein